MENTNKLLEKSIRGNGNPGQEGWEHRLAFEFNGMVLHELFFESLGGPGSKMSASSVLAEAMDVTYGGAKAWRERFLAIAKTRGIGWVMSARDRASNRLLTFWIDEHHLGLPANLQPVVLLDLWEHAYLQGLRCEGPRGIRPDRAQQSQLESDREPLRLTRSQVLRKLKTGQYRLYSRKTNPRTGRRRNLGTFATRAAAFRHERAIQYFKRH